MGDPIMPEPTSNSSAVPRDPGTVSSTMLEGLRAQDPDAWNRMVRLLGPLVYQWCRHRFGLQPNDADDMVQDVFAAVNVALPEFHRDRPGDSFRGWVWTIARNKALNFIRDNKKRPHAPGGTDANQRLQQLPNADSLPVEEPSQADGDRGIAWRALESIRDDFGETTWRAFWGMTFDDRSATDISAELGISPDAVRQAKRRVLKRLREAVGELLSTDLGRMHGGTT